MKPLTLFDQPLLTPDGFAYYPSFIDEEQEWQLLNDIRHIDLQPMRFHGYTANRKVASFGYDYHFTTRQLTKGKTIPEAFGWLLRQVAAQMMVGSEQVAEVLVTEYPPGSVINWHRDAPPFDRIAGLSLGGDVLFKFRPHEKSMRTRKSIVTFPVQRRSLYTMRGAARTEWEHSTAPVAATRYSITFRTLRASG